MHYIFSKKWKLTRKVLPFVALIVALKFATHYADIEFLSLSALFTAVISANIFLIGFLITGVLADYKESEKLPGDLAAGIEAIADECRIIYTNKKSEEAKVCLIFISDFTGNLIEWFHKKEKTAKVMEKITGLNKFFLDFEQLTQANFIVRMKQEQSAIRRMITRIHTIRETSFNEAGYTIAEIITALVIFGLLFIRIDPYYESVFFVGFVSFILLYMVFLIKDLDNPFAYYEKESLSEEVSLKPLVDLQKRFSNSISRNNL